MSNNGIREFQEDYTVDTLMEFIENSIKVLLRVSYLSVNSQCINLSKGRLQVVSVACPRVET